MLRIDVTPKNFGRVAAQAAKQVMIQKLREAERGSIYDEFSGREGDVITGVVKWNESRTIFVDLGRVEDPAFRRTDRRRRIPAER